MLRRLLPGSDFPRNTVLLIVGTVAAQSIPVLLQPLLRRIYTPEDFGAMAVYLTLFSLLTIVASLRYEAAIVLPKSDRGAASILVLALGLNLLISAGAMLVLLLAGNEVAALIRLPECYAAYLYLLPPACLAFGSYQAMNNWLIRKKAFRASAGNKVVRRTVEGAVQMACGLARLPGGLFIGDLAGNLANVLSGIRQILRNGFSGRFVTRARIGWAAKRFSEFPKYNALPTLLSNAASVLPILFINAFHSTETAGYFDLSRLVLSIPLVLVAATVSQVFYQQISEKKNSGLGIGSDIRSILKALLIIIAAGAAVIVFAGPLLFGLVFGENYALSGEFARILILSFSLNLISSSFSPIFLTFGKIRMNSAWQIAYFAAVCSLFFFRGMDIHGFLRVYVAVETLAHTAYLAMMYSVVRGYERGLQTKKAD